MVTDSYDLTFWPVHINWGLNIIVVESTRWKKVKGFYQRKIKLKILKIILKYIWLWTVRFSGESMISQMGGGWGHQSQKWGVNLSFGHFVAGNCMKNERIWTKRRGGGFTSLVPPRSSSTFTEKDFGFWILDTHGRTTSSISPLGWEIILWTSS